MVQILDGGFSTQLTVHVGDCVDGDELWSARFNDTNPEAVIATHLDFLQAGADIILTNTYQASVEGYQQYLNLSKDESLELIKKTVGFAHTAREKFMKKQENANLPMILASIGPYGAHLHDGSEYNGGYSDTVTADTIKDWHKTRIDAVLEAGVDGLAVETIPCQMEAEAIVDLLITDYPTVKFWVSLQCKDGDNIAHGEYFDTVAKSIWQKMRKANNPNLLAIGVNCLHPKYVSSLIGSLNGARTEADRIPLVIYPNSGEIYSVESGWQGRKECMPIADYVSDWIGLGAKFIGGCCRTYAKDIANIKKKLDELKV